MTQLMQQGQEVQHWKDVAIAKSEVITDSWEVVKTWTARLAEWILFICMVVNIVKILPGISLAGWISSVVLAVQVITLDIAGFGLQTMAETARNKGFDKAAQTGERTSKFLIGLMILTVVLVTVGFMFPTYKPYTDGADNALILVRVVMSVVYAHVVHSLRSAERHVKPSDTQQEIDRLRALVAQLQDADHTQINPQSSTQSIPATLTVPTRKRSTAQPAKKSASSASKIAAYRAKNPNATQAQIASALGVSVRTVQGYWNTQVSQGA